MSANFPSTESLFQDRRHLQHPNTSGYVEASSLIPSIHAPSVDAGVDFNLHPSGIIPVIQNIVATVNLECRLDLKTIALHARNAEYNPKANIFIIY